VLARSAGNFLDFSQAACNIFTRFVRSPRHPLMLPFLLPSAVAAKRSALQKEDSAVGECLERIINKDANNGEKGLSCYGLRSEGKTFTLLRIGALLGIIPPSRSPGYSTKIQFRFPNTRVCSSRID